MAQTDAQRLHAIFPAIEAEVLDQLLAFHDGSVTLVVAALLDTDDGDAAAARELQSDLDAQVARDMQAELEEEERRRTAQLLETRAAAAASRLAASTKSLAAKHLPMSTAVLQRIGTAVAKTRSRTGSVRLLDDQAAGTDPTADYQARGTDFLASNLHPADVERYMPPAPRPSATPTAAVAQYAGPAAAAVTTRPLASDAPTALYSARVDRARSANRVASRRGEPITRSAPLHEQAAATAPVALAPPRQEAPDLMAMEPPAPNDPWAELAAPPPLAPTVATAAPMAYHQAYPQARVPSASPQADFLGARPTSMSEITPQMAKLAVGTEQLPIQRSCQMVWPAM